MIMKDEVEEGYSPLGVSFERMNSEKVEFDILVDDVEKLMIVL